MNKMEFHKKVHQLTQQGVLKKEAFEQCYTIDSPFITYSSYRVWKSRNGIKDKSLLKCAKCSTIAERKASNQIYCDKCTRSNGVSNWNKAKKKKTTSDEPNLSPYIQKYLTNKAKKQKEDTKKSKELCNAVSKTLNNWKECESCGEMFKATKANSKYCCSMCNRIGSSLRVRECSICKKEFVKPYGLDTIRNECSNTCRIKRKRHIKWNERNKKRCEKYDKTYTPIDRQSVFDRDNNTCYKCGIVCDTSLHDGVTYNPNHITLDHIVSIGDLTDKGIRLGHHTLDNVRTCCMQCNVEMGVHG